jgi:hypothetical protein
MSNRKLPFTLPLEKVSEEISAGELAPKFRICWLPPPESVDCSAPAPVRVNPVVPTAVVPVTV